MESNHGSTTLFFATSKCLPRYLLCPCHIPQYRLHWCCCEMAASGYSEHDDWIFPIFHRAVTDLSLGLKKGASVGTTRWPPEPQNPTSCFASSSQYQRTISSPVLLCRYFLCAIGGCQSSPECGSDMGPLVAAGISKASGRVGTLGEYSGWFDRGGFHSSPQSTDI